MVTDLSLDQAEAAWYQMRFWIEDEYKDGKRGWFHWEHTKMTKPQRASRLWLVLGIARHMAILLGSELEAREQEQQARRRKRRAGEAPRRRGRPVVGVKRPRGREQSVLMRGVMAMRAAESGGGKVLPPGQMRAQPLPSQLYAVSRIPKSYQLKKQRREEKKRNRQRAQTRERREQRALKRTAEQGEKQARRQEKWARREAKQAAEVARRQEKQARRQARQAARLSHRQEKPGTGQASRASTSVPQKPPGNLQGHRLLCERSPEPILLPAPDEHRQGSGKHGPPKR